jgi:molybdenum cofactor synthesis domain-containing protein
VKTAGLIIIGDEILTGKVKDENSFIFAQLMFKRGIDLQRIIIIPDDIGTIAATIQQFIKSYDYVASSGGIGPTHDDVTLDAVAQALKRPLEIHQEARRYFEAAKVRAGRGEKELSLVQLKMLTYPQASQVYFSEPLWLGLIRIDNLFILPGVPSMFKQLIENYAGLFNGTQFYREIIYTDRFESTIAEVLGQAQHRFAQLKIGSYPQEVGLGFRVMVTIEGREEQLVHDAAQEILPAIDGRKII